MGKTYKFVKDYLEDGRRVLFTGTPCQIVGLKKYLGRYYANLILVDLLCANCPSAEIFNKYIFLFYYHLKRILYETCLMLLFYQELIS